MQPSRRSFFVQSAALASVPMLLPAQPGTADPATGVSIHVVALGGLDPFLVARPIGQRRAWVSHRPRQSAITSWIAVDDELEINAWMPALALAWARRGVTPHPMRLANPIISHSAGAQALGRAFGCKTLGWPVLQRPGVNVQSDAGWTRFSWDSAESVGPRSDEAATSIFAAARKQSSVRTIVVTVGGFDSHVFARTDQVSFEMLDRTLAAASLMPSSRVTLSTEIGRDVRENTAGGTDHGGLKFGLDVRSGDDGALGTFVEEMRLALGT